MKLYKVLPLLKNFDELSLFMQIRTLLEIYMLKAIFENKSKIKLADFLNDVGIRGVPNSEMIAVNYNNVVFVEH